MGNPGQINPKETKREKKERSICDTLLQKRYSECDSDGHKDPDTKQNNYCTHCYRHLVYKTPRTSAMRAERAKLPRPLQPFDASMVAREYDEEIKGKKTEDYWKGLTKIHQELQESGELEQLLDD